MSATPALAFVVPAYNATATLGDTLRSIVAQTIMDLEVVVVDDGSHDDPGTVVAAMGDPRIRLWRQANKGLAGARNAGLARTKAPAVCFLDADDMIAPGFSKTMLARLHNADLAPCAYRMIGEHGEDLRWVVLPADHDLSLVQLENGNPLGVGGVVFRREAADRHRAGGELFDESLRELEDWDLWLRMTRAGAIWAPMEPEPLFWCRLRPGSLSRGLERMWRTGLIVLARAQVRPACLRRWHLRTLARAVAASDIALIALVSREVGAIREEDLGVLAGALHEAFCREHRVGPEDGAAHQAQWRDRIRRLLPDRAWGRTIAARVVWARDRWGAVARAAAARLSRGDQLVVYGAGMNGRAILATLDQAGVPALVIDDHPGAAPGRARTTVAQLTQRHVVLVTPEDRDAIIAKLAAAGIERVLLPEALLGSSDLERMRAPAA